MPLEARPGADRPAALALGKRRADQRQAARHQQRRADTLHGARSDQLLHVARRSAGQRRAGRRSPRRWRRPGAGRSGRPASRRPAAARPETARTTRRPIALRTRWRCKSRWIAGSATLTTVPSMKAMLEPRIAAINTQRLAEAAQGAARAPWRIAASSQGPRTALLSMACVVQRKSRVGTRSALRAMRLMSASVHRPGSTAMAVLSEISVRSRADIARIEAEMTLEQRLPERSVLDVFIAAAERDPDRTALTMLMTGAPDEQPRRVNYRELLGLVRRAANLFAALAGPRPGVAYMLPSLVETHATLWGAETAGFAVPINFLLQPEPIAALARSLGRAHPGGAGPAPRARHLAESAGAARARARADAAARGPARHAARSRRARLPCRADGAARRPSRLRRARPRRRRGGVLPHRRHDRHAQARGAHAPRPARRGARRRVDGWH